MTGETGTATEQGTGTVPERGTETHNHADRNDIPDAGVCRAAGVTPRALPSVAALAFLGDAVHTRFVRRQLVGQGISHAKDLNREALRFVTAPMQEKAYLAVRERLTEEERDVFRRAFNLSHINRPKNVSGETYRTATGYEAVLGMLDYLGAQERLEKLLIIGFDACR